MKEIRIKIPQWSDFTKWFWDRFCYPRRKQVAEWIEYHDDCLQNKIRDYLWDYLDCNVNSTEAERFKKETKWYPNMTLRFAIYAKRMGIWNKKFLKKD